MSAPLPARRSVDVTVNIRSGRSSRSIPFLVLQPARAIGIPGI
jgi:hypothetical protein